MTGQYMKVMEKKLVRASPTTKRRKKFARSHLEVHMFNVKEGEAILLVFPKKRTWIVDCGTSNFESSNKKLGQKLAEYLKREKLVLEALVASHAHADHAGAFAALLQNTPKLARRVFYWRNEGPSWKRKSKWIPKLNKELKKLGSKLEHSQVMRYSDGRHQTPRPNYDDWVSNPGASRESGPFNSGFSFTNCRAYEIIASCTA